MVRKTFSKLICAALLFTFLSAAVGSAAAGGKALPYNEITHDDRKYENVTAEKHTYAYDFSDDDFRFYSNEEALSTAELRTNMVFDGKTLSCKPGKTFSFGSSVFLGDDYGLYGGDASFTAEIKGGRLSAGVRLSKKAPDDKHRGVWFVFENGDITVSEPESKLSAKISGAPFSSGKITISDKCGAIEFYVNDTLLCRVLYEQYTGALTVKDASGKTLSQADSTHIRPAGYITLYADGLDGYIDDLSFGHTDITVKPTETAGVPIDYTVWTATDDRGRTPASGVAPRENKQVGMFYFLCHLGTDSEFIQDNTRIFTEYGLEELTDHLSDPKQSGAYYWAEPYFGYYTSNDKWVFRKHAAQLSAAGVDFIFLDFTNGAFYPDQFQTLLDTWLEIRHEGGSTPDICVFCAGVADAVMGPLRNSVYSEEGFEKYGELFYEYKGKPLLLAGVSDSDKSDFANWLRDTFTIRDCWAWQDSNGGWNWLQEYRKTGDKYKLVNGGKGRDKDGNFEELALCVGHHPTTSKGRSYANVRFPKIKDNDYGFSLDSGAGTGYESQFEAIMYFDPDMILITGWNEWVAGLTHYNEDEKFAGSDAAGFQFVDQFNTEYSRDAEPMKMRQGDGVGFGDNFYYQTVDFIRRYKGTGDVTKAVNQITVDLTDVSSWNGVGPEYNDTVGDAAWRSEEGVFKSENYVNNTGRNDLVSAKVSQDKEYLYFEIKTADRLIKDDGENWMNLFINTDDDPSTGWEGYDLVLNRHRDGHYVSVESLAGGWDGYDAGQALYALYGDGMVIRLSKEVAGIGGKADRFSFKWADNSTSSGSVMEFSDLGDAAPDDRFAYVYLCDESADQTPSYVYTLTGANGDAEELRDEKQPLTPEETAAAADTETEKAVTRKVVMKHSAALKVMIIVTGAVVGACIFTVIIVSDTAKRRKAAG